MADITKYLDGLNYTITAEKKCLMDIFAEAWEYCRGRDCSDCEYHGEGNERGKMLICISYQYAKRLIEAGYKNVTLTADAAPVVHGHWIKTEHMFASTSTGRSGNIHVCSECGEQSGVGFKTPWCAICGAKMDGGDTDV